MSVTAVWFLLAVAATVGQDFNEEMDGFFSRFREDIKGANNNQFPLPNVCVEYTKKIFFMTVRGEWNGTSGTFSDMGSIMRTNNATVVTSRDHFVFRAEFGFADLKVRYKYSAKFLGIPFKGDLELGVAHNSIALELLVNLTENRCSGDVVTIRKLRFRTLDGVTARVTGFSLANGLVGYWLGGSLSTVSTSVTSPIEAGLSEFLRENIKEFDFCKYGTVPDNVPFDDRDSSGDLSFSRSPADSIIVSSQEINAILN